MKALPAVLFLMVFLAVANASDDSASRYRAFLAADHASEEQLSKIQIALRIADNYSPPVLIYEVQNSLPNTVVVGFVVKIDYKDPETNKDSYVEIFVDSGDVLPLSSQSGTMGVFQSDKIAKSNPKVTVKDIRVRSFDTKKP